MTPLVNCLSYVSLNVKDLDACVADAQNVTGLRLVERTDRRALLTTNTRHAELILNSARENLVDRVGLEALSAEAVDETAGRARKEGLRIVSERPSLECIERSVTFATSEGHIFEVHTAMPNDQPRRYPGPGIHPRRIDHVNLACVDPQKTFDEMHRVVGIKLSQRTTGCELMWARAADGRHHTVAFVKGKAGLHHFCWELAQFSDFMRLGDVLDCYDRLLVWGPGRHGAGDNIFAYYVDQGGFLIECSLEMEIIDDSQGFEPRVIDVPPDLSNPKVVNRWGAPPPLAWIQHHTDFARPASIAASA